MRLTEVDGGGIIEGTRVKGKYILTSIFKYIHPASIVGPISA